MDVQPPDGGSQLGLVLKGKIYQDTFSFTVTASSTPWSWPQNKQINSARLLLRPLPLRSLSVPISAACVVSLISILIWNGTVPSLAVSHALIFERNEWWRILSAQFQHADAKHLLNNLLAFIGIGWVLWGYFGLTAFPVIPVLAGAVANFIAVFTYSPEVRIIGLSGTVFAMGGLWAALYVKNDFRYSYGKRILRSCGFLLLLFFPLSLDAQVSDRVHFLGLLSGLAAGAAGWGSLRPHLLNADSNSAGTEQVQ